jgi:hypothetical protein
MSHFPSSQTVANPVFVIGSPRSGTAILSWSLAQHSCFWTSGESYVLWELFGNSRGAKGLDMIFQTARVLADGSWITLQRVERSELLAYLGLGVNAMFTSRSGGRRWIDHTPVQTMMIDTLGQMFPDACFLHMLRDGRCVVESMTHFWDALEDHIRANFLASGWKIPWLEFTNACRTWRQHVRTSIEFAKNNPGRCLTVRHDRLSSDTPQCFREIYEFLGVSYEEAPVTFIRSNQLHPSPANGGALGPSLRDGHEIWKAWSPEQRQIFLEEAAPTLVEYGLASQGELR